MTKNILILFSATMISFAVPAQVNEAETWFENNLNSLSDSEADAELASIAASASLSSKDSSVPKIIDPAGYVYQNRINPSAPYHKTKTGIIITGEPGKVRAMEPYGWSVEGVKRYATIANEYAAALPGVQVYCMPVPLASAFYSPDAAAPAWNRSQYAAIRKMFSFLNPGVKGVNLIPILGEHASEHIYSRTDHHWAPLGAYYAANQLAAHASVPFLPLSQYKKHEIPGYVGTMYKYSGDASVKNSPETFVYYTPQGVQYKTTFINFKTSGLNVTGESAPAEGQFFQNFKGVASYCTFMGGDTKITKVTTSTKNGRRVLILKDSFGNAIPGYLFGSFEEVHVADCRYFNRNMKKYITDNKITDVVFANNISHACSQRTCSSYRKYLNQ